MSDLPLPLLDPEGFLRGLQDQDDWQMAARAVGCDVHLLGAGPDMATLAALHGAGARALAASIARGGRPMVLLCSGISDPASYATALETGLMGYERVFARVPSDGATAVARPPALGLAMILILPPSETNSYWQRKG